MCTVTYIPKQESGYILTSNRDESVNRAKALTPQLTQLGVTNVLFPKDASKGGTWIGTTDQSKTLCLLNGAFVKHQVTNNYIKSRGLVVLDFFQSKDTESFIASYSLKGIEPFTLVIIDGCRVLSLIELKWDGHKKHIQKLDPHASHIWSSATLYNSEEATYKAEVFKAFVKNNPTADEILAFHENGIESNTDLMRYINPNSPIETISITQVEQIHTISKIRHKDLLNNSISNNLIELKEEELTV